MNKLTPGQQVRVINDQLLPGNDKKPDIKGGDIEIISQLHVCHCGELHVDIGLSSKLNYITCYKCQEELPGGHTHHWCHSSRFELVTPGL